VRQAVARPARTGTSQPLPAHGDESEDQLNDLQKSILAATRKLRTDGHPLDAP